MSADLLQVAQSADGEVVGSQLQSSPAEIENQSEVRTQVGQKPEWIPLLELQQIASRISAASSRLRGAFGSLDQLEGRRRCRRRL